MNRNTFRDEQQHHVATTRGAPLNCKKHHIVNAFTYVLHLVTMFRTEREDGTRGNFALDRRLLNGGPSGLKLEAKNGAQTYGARSGAVLSISGSGPVYFCSIEEIQFWHPFWYTNWSATKSNFNQECNNFFANQSNSIPHCFSSHGGQRSDFGCVPA